MLKKRYLFFISQNYSFAILRPIQKVISQRGDQVCWFVMGNSVNMSYFNEDEKRLSSVEEIVQYDPMAVLYPSNMAPNFLPGINVAVFHGFDAGKVDKKGNNDHFKIRNCFDLYCTQGPDSTNQFKALQKTHNSYEVIETGWCALDPLFEPLASTEQTDKPTILLCSTFSQKLSCAPHLLNTVERLSKQGKWRWLIQFHPKMPTSIVESYKAIQSEHLTFVETDNIIPILRQADVMVCDTSSVLLMFLLQIKPVVTFKNISPGSHLIDIDNPEDLEKSIELALTKPKSLMENITRFRNNIHPYDDGNASERVLAAIDTAIANQPNKKRKRRDIIRQFKMRKQLNYWRF